MPRRPREVPPPHPLIGFTQPAPVAGDHLIRVVVHMDTKSKKWGFFEVARAVVVADDIDDVPDVPADLEYPFNDLTEAVHAALEVRASAGNQFRIVRDPRSGRWGYHEVPRSVHPAEDDIVPDDVQFPFNTVAEATAGALRHLEPYWGDPSTALLIEGGVAVPGMPVNARIIGSPGYRAPLTAASTISISQNSRPCMSAPDGGVASKPERPRSNTTFRSASRFTPSENCTRSSGHDTAGNAEAIQG